MRLRVCFVVLVVLAVALLAGCGGSSKTSSSSTNASAAATTTGATGATTTSSTGTTGTTTTGTKGPNAGRIQGRGLGNRTSSPAFKTALAKFATCLRQNGVNISAPNTSGSGPIFSTKGINTSSAQFRTAERKCSATLRTALKASAGASGTAGAAGSSGQTKVSPATRPPVKVPPKVARAFQQFTACMREHGITNFPEPEGASFNLSHTHVDSSSAQYKAAEATCNHILSGAF